MPRRGRLKRHGRDGAQRKGLEDWMWYGVHVEVEARQCLRGWPKPQDRVARNLTVVGVMIRSVVRVLMRMGKGQLYRQLTRMADERQEDEHEYERRR